MRKFYRIFSVLLTLLGLLAIGFLVVHKPADPLLPPLPTVAIANYGPHASLEAAITGIKTELAQQGFIEGKTVRYKIADVGFDASLIPQMIAQLKNVSPKPNVMVVMTTPVAQFAKNNSKDIPLIYSVITDPLEAGLGNMAGASDKQDLKILVNFAKQLIPHVKRIGLLYATAESNDIALVKMMKEVAQQNNMEVVAIPVDHARDVPMRMQGFKGKVDFIYVGPSGPIQPTLPVIVAQSKKMGIPVLNMDENAVKDNLVLASFGVNYKQVGINTGKLISQVLKGQNVKTLVSLYPTAADHHGFISRKKANELGILIPEGLNNVEIK